MPYKLKNAIKPALLTYALLIWIQQIGEAQSKLPSIDYLPQSPVAAAYSRYGEIPVDYSTGVPKIEIPIYTVRVGEVSIPISITYHASGIKVGDIPSEVGLGFVLNCGGVVTANILGRPDVENAKPTQFNKSSDITDAIWNARSTGNQMTTHSLAESYWNILTSSGYQRDFFSDRYSYSLCTGESGTFRRDFITGQLKLMPYRPVKINLQEGNPIDIVASNGYTHYFNKISDDLYVLNKIVSADKTEEIIYNYSNRAAYHPSYHSMLDWRYEELIVDPYYPYLLKLRTQLDGYTYSDMRRTDESSVVTTPLIESVVTTNEIISFQYANDRLDKNNNGNRLIKITVKSKASGQIIKSVQLNHSYFGAAANENLRLRLDNIQFSGSTTGIVEQYSFGYNNSNPLPPFPNLNQSNCSEDYWGYYNGSSSNNFIPGFFYNFNVLPGGYNYADRSVNPAFNQACMLTQINHPAGGKTVFEYESNIMPGPYPQEIVGGLRIKKITSYTDATSKAFVKKYEYNSAETKPIQPANFWYQQECWIVHQYHDDMGTPSPPVAAAYHKNIGLSNSLRPLTVGTGLPVIYTTVTEYTGDETTNIGKTVYEYNYEDNEQRNPMSGNIEARFFSSYHSDVGNYTPELKKTSVYKAINGNYEIVETNEKVYNKFKQSEFNTGVNFGSTVEVGIEAWGIGRGLAFLTYDLGNYQSASGYYTDGYDYLSSLVYTDTKGYEEVSLVTDEVTKKYVNNAVALQTTRTYQYDSDYTLLKGMTESNSKGEAIRSETKYPTDFASQALYGTMVVRNILSPVVEQLTYKNNNFVQSVKTNYDYWDGNGWSVTPTDLVVPHTVETKIRDNGPEVRIRYHSYDEKGNVTTVSKEGDAPKTYLWGYNHTYLVAQVMGKSYTDVVAQSGINLTLLNNATTIDAVMRAELHKLRTLSGCLVTTYTYKPLIGMTSQIDPNGRTTYYEYDAFGRLSLIRDKDNNVLKKFCYNYAGQPEGCSSTASFGNTAINDYYLSQNCSSGQTPVPYYVTIPTGQFTAASQAEADAAARQYAQGQANQYGGCQAAEVQLSYSNYGGDEVTVELEDVNGNWYFFTLPYGNGSLGFVPPGVYNVYFWPNNYYQYHSYSAGCGYYTSGAYNVAITTVPISNACHNISVY